MALLGFLGPPLCFHRADRRLDTKRLQALDHLGADSAVDAHAAERDAAVAAVMLDPRANKFPLGVRIAAPELPFSPL